MGDIVLHRLQELRKHRGLSQAGLAQRSGLSRKTVNELETGRTVNPRLETIIRLAKALDVAASELM
jgi:transcriptional regulator with XRE-family HTH domain